MPVVINLLAICSDDTLAPVQATEDVPTAEADNEINTKMESMIKAFEA